MCKPGSSPWILDWAAEEVWSWRGRTLTETSSQSLPAEDGLSLQVSETSRYFTADHEAETRITLWSQPWVKNGLKCVCVCPDILWCETLAECQNSVALDAGLFLIFSWNYFIGEDIYWMKINTEVSSCSWSCVSMFCQSKNDAILNWWSGTLDAIKMPCYLKCLPEARWWWAIRTVAEYRIKHIQ